MTLQLGGQGLRLGWLLPETPGENLFPRFASLQVSLGLWLLATSLRPLTSVPTSETTQPCLRLMKALVIASAP